MRTGRKDFIKEVTMELGGCTPVREAEEEHFWLRKNYMKGQ